MRPHWLAALACRQTTVCRSLNDKLVRATKLIPSYTLLHVIGASIIRMGHFLLKLKYILTSEFRAAIYSDP